jgi:DNA mismatch repair protein MutS2
MLLYPQDLTEAFEFDKIRERLADHCRSLMGAEYARSLPVLTDPAAINRLLDEAEDFRRMLLSDHAFPEDTYPDARADIAWLDQDESVLEEEACVRLRAAVRAYERVHRFLLAQRDMYPALCAVVEVQRPPVEVSRAIDKVLDEEGQIRPNASPQLVQIRRDMDARRRELVRAFRSALSRLRQAGVLAEAEESVRNGRQVLALRSEFKRRFSGIVHDESESGKTTFLEPEETVHLNNELAELEREERREIRRILRELTRQIAPHQEELAQVMLSLGWMDFCRARGLFAAELGAGRPEISKGSRVILHHARHPLLYLLQKRLGKNTVPLDMELDAERRILVVSGPNAGGKSVCLKTAGLLQLMVQSGLLVPADSRLSRFGIFRQILADIGDTQSLEDELSTYSSRLQRMRYFLEHADSGTLFLIDEFGSGTDPDLGGAVAEAILDAMRRSGAFGVVTTHYANLKIYAGRTPGVDNGAMVFDEERLEPRYRLETGKPGSSYTFDIARKIPLPAGVIRHAESLVRTDNLDFEGLLHQVQAEQAAIAQKTAELAEREKELSRQIGDYQAATRRLDEERQQLRLAKTEKQLDAIARYEAQFGELLQQLRDKQASEQLQAEAIQQAARKARAEGENLRGEVKRIRKALRYEDSEEPIEEGSAVRLLEGRETGRVIELRNNKALVQFGQIKTRVPVDELVPVRESAAALSPKPRRAPQMPAPPSGDFSRELDLRGKTREEAIEEVDRYLNEAVLRSVASVRIIHGKGSGVLREAVRKTAKQYSAVRSMRHELPELGGDGVTVIEFG